jgi:hypothetical protein
MANASRVARSPGRETGRLEMQRAAKAHGVGRSGHELGRKAGALQREGRGVSVDGTRTV